MSLAEPATGYFKPFLPLALLDRLPTRLFLRGVAVLASPDVLLRRVRLAGPSHGEGVAHRLDQFRSAARENEEDGKTDHSTSEPQAGQ